MTSYNYKKLTKKLKILGFRFFRQGRGSHVLWVRDGDKTVIPIPKHSAKDIKLGTLHEICKQIGLKNKNDLDKIN